MSTRDVIFNFVDHVYKTLPRVRILPYGSLPEPRHDSSVLRAIARSYNIENPQAYYSLILYVENSGEVGMMDTLRKLGPSPPYPVYREAVKGIVDKIINTVSQIITRGDVGLLLTYIDQPSKYQVALLPKDKESFSAKSLLSIFIVLTIIGAVVGVGVIAYLLMRHKPWKTSGK